MNMQKTIFSLALLLVATTLAQAQFYNEGKLKVWTSQKVAREKSDYDAGFKKIRVAKLKGFDRITVEFEGDLPAWEVSFVKPPIYLSESNKVLNIDGIAFVAINFAHIPYPDASPKNYVLNFPKEKLKLSVISEIVNSDWFEGYLSFAVGLKAKTIYRVRELTNPSWVVIDFKH